MHPFRLYLLFFLFFPVMAMATHNRAGEITYEHKNGSTYIFTVTTCTKTSAPADREYLEINWDDGTGIDSIKRDNITILSNDAQENTYTAEHTFVGAGTFTISVEDPNRNSGVINIDNSVQVPFCIRTQLVISPFAGGGHNNSVQFTYRSCNETGCLDKLYCHNVGAHDPDGDSLAYSLVQCRGENCNFISSYQYPDEINPGPNNEISIDPVTGDLCWENPQKRGVYNLAIKVREFRNGNQIGYVIRDMQVIIEDCPNNDPPFILPVPDTCVEAGTTLDLDITGIDTNGFQEVTLTATGAPLLMNDSPASFTQGISHIDTVVGHFIWNTQCSHVSPDEYQVTFKAEDNASGTSVSLVDYESFFIKVVAPAPENLTAQPSGNTINLNWTPDSCTNADGYKIYRRKGFYGFDPDHCETDVPAYTGYRQIGATNGHGNTSFVDDNGLVHGEQYCYMVVATFPNGAVSYASEEVCTELKKDVPVITHVSVGRTDPNKGIDTIQWGMPTELDTNTQYPGPYEYKIYRAITRNNNWTQVGSTPQSPSLAATDTAFIDSTTHNTRDDQHKYKVELFSGSDTVGETNEATSVYLNLIPNDEQLGLQWDFDVPWTNNIHYIYKKDTTGQFQLLDSTQNQSYTDTGLVNGDTYCYYIKTKGKYAAPGLVHPIINYSQINCDEPEDHTPPCGPSLSIEADCEAIQNTLRWTYPDTCEQDVGSYNLYFAPTLDDSIKYVRTVDNPYETTLTHSDGESIAGCYQLTAVDSNDNESIRSNRVCADNCPEYRLPNVFTPNGDGQNDFLSPFPYKFIESIDMEIYNRWGQVVHTTQNPDIQWDGEHKNTGEPVPEGVYYYVCKVDQITLRGIETTTLKGQLQLLRDGPKSKPE